MGESSASVSFFLESPGILLLASRVMRRFVLAVVVGLLAAAALRAQPASAPWRTIETAHFRVHFPAPYEAWAARTAAAIEGIHERVTDFVGFRPARKIDVLVQDPLAEANGIAYPFLDRPVIVLWTSPPEAESGIGDYDEWMDLVTTHEMAHIVHLTRPRNRPGFLERLLPLPIGPVALNSPRWLAEGYATVVEGALTGSGRPLPPPAGSAARWPTSRARPTSSGSRRGKARAHCRSCGSGWPRAAAETSARLFARSSGDRPPTFTTGSAPR
jgi:hypothetical protein